MTKKNKIKIALDTLMLLVLVLMYNAHTPSISFHEIGGLALIGVFMIHVLINGKWVTRIGAQLFRKELKASARIGWIVDALLLLSFAAIGVTGAMISKTLFHLRGGFAAKRWHYFFSALSVVLMGVHLGLHTAFIHNAIKKLVRLPKVAAHGLAVVLVLALVGFGGYNLVQGSFVRWVTGPFQTMQGGMPQGSESRGEMDGFGKKDGKGKNRKDIAASEADEDATESETDLPQTEGNEQAETAPNHVLPEGERERSKEERMHDEGMGDRRTVNPLTLLLIALRCFSEIFVFAVITALVRKLFGR